MRGFFFLLLLTNVAFLAWQVWQDEPAAQDSPYHGVAPLNEGLTLLSELPAGERPALREAPVQATVPRAEATQQKRDEPVAQAQRQEALGRICLRVGPIAEREVLDKLAASLKRLGAEDIQEGSGQSQKTNYWVMLPPYESRKKASEAASLLKQSRVRDFFIVRSGEYENAVSLGVFSTQERARRRFEEIAGLKARLRRPRIEEIVLPAKHFTLRFELPSRERRAEVAGLIKEQGLGAAEEIRCE